MADRKDLTADIGVTRIAAEYASSGDNAVISAPGAGFKIQVYGYELQAHGTVSAKLQSSNASPVQKSPLWSLQDREGAVATPGLNPLFELPDNEGLELNLSGAIEVSLAVTYSVRAT